MNRSIRRCKRGAQAAILLVLAWGAPAAASVKGPGWGHLEYSYVSTNLQSDESGEGARGQLILPLSRTWFITASGSEIDAKFDNPAIPITERITSGSAGLGVHSIQSKLHMYGQLSYASAIERVHFTDGSGTDTRERVEGGVFAMGFRSLLQPFLLLEPELGLGYFGDDRSIQEYARIKLALRVIPRVWLVGGYDTGLIFGDQFSWSAGLRLAWSDATVPRRRPPGAKLTESVDRSADAHTALAPGVTMRATRLLRLQARPLFGAPETVDVPAGTPLQLHESLRNEFGPWWRVSADGRDGWIRESELK